jgi:hypothetical protein
MSPRPTLLLGAVCVIALGCAAHLPSYEQWFELNASGSDPWGRTRQRIAGVLETRHYTLPEHFHWQPIWRHTQDWTPWGIRLRADGWDQMDVTWSTGLLENQTPPTSYRWIVRARTFASDGAERPASAEARADADSIVAELGTLDTLVGASSATPTGPEWWEVGREARRRTCAGGWHVGAFTALPHWAGTPDKGTNAERIAATLEASGWTIVKRFPYASPGWLVARRSQPGGADVVTVYAGGLEDPRRYGIRTWYEMRTASCDSAQRRGPPRAETRADAERLLVALRDAIATER